MIHTEMKRIQRLALAMMLVLLVLGTGSVYGAGADGADIQFNCPCTFTSTDGSSGSFSVGIKNIAASATPALSFEIWLHTTNVVGEDALFLASGNIGSIGAATTTSPQPVSVNLEGPASGSYFATVDLLSEGEIVDQLRLADEIPMGAGFSTTDIELLQDSDGDGVADYNERLENTDPDSASSTPGTTIVDLMVVYDDSLPTEYSNDHLARIDHIVTVSNTVLSDSQVNMQLRLVNSTNINSTQSYGDMLSDASAAAGVYTGLPALRDQYGADLVTVVTAREDSPEPSCGVATLGGMGANDVPLEGFMDSGVHVNVNDARFDTCDDMTVLHEIGHNMGLGHSAKQNETGTFVWSRGYGLDDRFHTVMAYGDAFNEPPQIQILSNPEVTICDGSPCGVALDASQPSHAAKALDAVRFQVARYRPTADSGSGGSTGGSGDGGSASTSDTDGDGIPNVFESILGSDPGVADADQDADSDGTTNIAAFNALPSATHYLQTTSSSANITSLHIVNGTATAQPFTGTLYNGDGTQLGDSNVPLSTSDVPGNGRLVLTSPDLESLFGVSAWKGPAMLVVKGAGPFELMAKLISPSGLTSNTNCVRSDRVLNIEGFDSSNMTFVRFINTTDQNLGPVTGTLYDGAGNVIGAADTTLVDTLSPRQQVWVNRNNFATLVGAEWNGEAMLELGSVEGLKLLNLNFVNNETFFNFSCFETAESGRVYLQTTSTSANISYTHIVNTSDIAQQFTGTLYDGNGNQLGTSDQPLHDGSVQPRGRIILASDDLEDRFQVSPWKGPAMFQVKGAAQFELMTKLTSPSDLISNTNCVRSNRVHNIEGFDSQDQTFVRFINLGSTTLTDIRGTLYAADGSVIGSQDQVLVSSLAPNAATWVNRDALSGIVGDSWNGEAMLEVDTIADLRLLNLNFVNSETFFNFSCYEKAD